jgi:putative ABC transport system permease protein
MKWVAWKMLTGDRAKYLGTVFGVAFGVLLISQQTSIFVGIISRTASQVIDVREPDFWVMDPFTQNADDIKPLAETDLYRVRGVPGVDWAVRLYKGQTRARTDTGHFWQSILIGLDDHSLVGAPAKMLQGDLADLRRPDSVIIDEIGYKLLWPGQPITLGRELSCRSSSAASRHATTPPPCSPPSRTRPVCGPTTTAASSGPWSATTWVTPAFPSISASRSRWASW